MNLTLFYLEVMVFCRPLVFEYYNFQSAPVILPKPIKFAIKVQSCVIDEFIYKYSLRAIYKKFSGLPAMNAHSSLIIGNFCPSHVSQENNSRFLAWTIHPLVISARSMDFLIQLLF